MKPEELTEEQKTKLKSCKDSDELMSALGSMGIELSDEQLDVVAGGAAFGEKWDQCRGFCPSFGL